jgi:hypothetical protein
MHSINKIFLFILLNAAVNQLSGQKLSVETLLDTNIIAIGDQIDLHYNIEKREGVQLRLPDFSQPLVAGIEIIGNPVIDSTEIENNLWQINVAVKITSFDTGLYCIPAQPIVFRDRNFSDTLLARAAYLMVQGVPIDTTLTVRDIKTIASAPVTLLEILFYVIPIILVALIGYLLYRYLRRRKTNGTVLKPLKSEEPAYITALRELDKIKAQKLWQQKHIKDYYTRITYVIRWYIKKRFNIDALETTSDEILRHIKTENLDNINYVNLESLLNLADLVKFAKGQPDPEENITHLDNAYDFIKKSREEKLEYPPETQKEE